MAISNALKAKKVVIFANQKSEAQIAYTLRDQGVGILTSKSRILILIRGTFFVFSALEMRLFLWPKKSPRDREIQKYAVFGLLAP